MTSKTLKQVSWLTALALGTGLGLSSPAEACSGPVCKPDVEVPLPNPPGTVPANVPALVLQSTKGAALITSGANAPRLLRSNGDVVATTTMAPTGEHNTWRVLPASPLAPGETYRLQGVGECGSTQSQPVEVSFTAGAAAPLPTATGTLRVETTARGKLRVAHGSQCTMEQDSSYARLRFTPAPELVPFLPWVRWSLEVDGKPWTLERHGAVLPDGTLAPPTQWQLVYDPRRLFLVHTSCVDPRLGGDPGLSPGKHRATLRPVLAQAPNALPPVEVDFEVSCETAMEPPAERPGDVEQLPLPGHGCSHAGGASMLALPGLLALGFLVRRRTHQVLRSGS